GFEPEEGMAFEFEDGLYFGQDAVHRLALLGTRSGTFNRVNRWLLGSTRRAALAYPVLRMGRNAALFLLGRIRLREPSVGARAPWLLFHHALGLFALLHALTNSFRYNPPGYPSTWLMGALGIGAAAATGLHATGSHAAAADIHGGCVGAASRAFQPHHDEERPAAGDGGLRHPADVAGRRLVRVLQRFRPHRSRV